MSTTHRYSLRRPVTVCIVLIALLVAAIVADRLVRRQDSRQPGTTPTPVQATAWNRVLAGIGPDGVVSFETALAAFTLAIGPLPGVPQPEGRRSLVASGTGALRWLQGYRSRLTQEQRAVLDGYLARDAAAAATAPRAAPSTGPVVRSFRRSLATAAPMEGASDDAGCSRGVPDPLTATDAKVLEYLDGACAEIGRLLGRPLTIPFWFVIHGAGSYDVDLDLMSAGEAAIACSNIQGTLTAVPEPHAAGKNFRCDDATQESLDLAYTSPGFGFGNHFSPARCVIHVNPALLPTLGDPELKTSLTHEMFHCYQAAKASDANEWTSTKTAKPWLIEGSAEWVGETVGGSTSLGLDWWAQYLRTPEKKLFERGYDAVGFYVHMREKQIDPWLHFDKMMYASNAEAYDEAVKDARDAFADTWASGHTRLRPLGQAWDATGPWTTDAHATVIPVSVGRGARTIEADPYTGRDYAITAQGEILHVQPQGHVRMADASGFDSVLTAPLLLCVALSACGCPKGKTYRGPQLITAKEPLTVALTGAVAGASLVMRAERFDSAVDCVANPTPISTTTTRKPPNGPTKSRPRCTRGCPGSYGDPHLYTVDRVAYDFMAAGEFTLLRSPDDAFELQVRLDAVETVNETERRAEMTNNTALAVRVGERRAGVYLTPAGLRLRVDGVSQTGLDPIELGAGASVQLRPGGVELVLPDGTVTWALARGPGYGIFVTVDPSPALITGGTGLIGRSAPGIGLPRLPDGTALPEARDRHDRYTLLYERFAEAWRVTPALTLFDYEPGKSTESYTIHGYPSAPKVATFQELAPDAQAAGTAACSSIADVVLASLCAFDVAVTHDAGFVGPYVATERVHQLGSAALDIPIATRPPTPTPAPPATVIPENPPVEIVPAFYHLSGVAMSPDGTLYASLVMGDRTGRVMAINALTGTILRQIETTGAGAVVTAAGSVWVAELTAPAGGAPPCSVSRLEPSTLALIATIPTICQSLRTGLVAAGDDVWVLDPTTGGAAGPGGMLRRIDTTANSMSITAVALPFAYGLLSSSATAIFYSESGQGQYRLRPGETKLSRIGNPGTDALRWPTPAGDGAWSATDDGRIAFYTTANGPDGTLDISDADGGILVGADSSSVYLDRGGPGGTHQLWRRYLDARPPTRLAAIGRTTTGYGAQQLEYFNVDVLSHPFLIGEKSVARVWVAISRTDPTQSLLLIQGARLPSR